MKPMTVEFETQLANLKEIERNVPSKLLPEVKQLENGLHEYQKWDAARAMVINYLTERHGLHDPYQWAFKTIELLKAKQ